MTIEKLKEEKPAKKPVHSRSHVAHFACFLILALLTLIAVVSLSALTPREDAKGRKKSGGRVSLVKAELEASGLHIINDANTVNTKETLSTVIRLPSATPAVYLEPEESALVNPELERPSLRKSHEDHPVKILGEAALVDPIIHIPSLRKIIANEPVAILAATVTASILAPSLHARPSPESLQPLDRLDDNAEHVEFGSTDITVTAETPYSTTDGGSTAYQKEWPQNEPTSTSATAATPMLGNAPEVSLQAKSDGDASRTFDGTAAELRQFLPSTTGQHSPSATASEPETLSSTDDNTGTLTSETEIPRPTTTQPVQHRLLHRAREGLSTTLKTRASTTHSVVPSCRYTDSLTIAAPITLTTTYTSRLRLVKRR